MTLNRYAKKRDLVEPEIVDALVALGCSVSRLDTPVDLLVGYRGQTILMEVKTGRAPLTKSQRLFVSAWTGGDLAIVRTVSEAIEVIRQTR